MLSYTLPHLAGYVGRPPIASDPLWQQVPPLQISAFRPESTSHRPVTVARLFHNQSTLFGLFEVQDRYVRCVHTTFGSRTHKDSCVELFLQPKTDRGYFSFEINCGGAMTVLYVTDPTRLPDGFFKEFVWLSQAEAEPVVLQPSMPRVVDPEIETPVSWTLGFAIPVSVLEPYEGKIGLLAGQRWRANAFKCGDETSHPHWASWSPVPELNFHLPAAFGSFHFG